MTALLDVLSLPTVPKHDDELAHLVCCDDDIGTKALCGTGVAKAPWGDGAHETDCVVCVDLGRSDFCPRYGRCK